MQSNATTPSSSELGRVGRMLDEWQSDDGPLHLHTGDLGWYSLRGRDATAAAIRVWADDGEILAIGLLDGADLLRLAIDPARREDAALAARIAADVSDPTSGVLGSGSVTVEARGAVGLGEELASHGWRPDEPWTPLRRDLSAPIETSPASVETVDPDRALEWVSVHWSAFRGTPPPAERLHAMADGWSAATRAPFSDAARILLLRDREGRPVAVSAVWSAGVGRPGLIEPLGVHREHQGQGHGVAMTRAAAAALRELGASSATVCAESSNAGAIATYLKAGFLADAEVADWRRAPL
ncbi:GNAT family N-acetyltransferase [Microbacterium marinum]|uniref:GNAT family N-acetyltransferase n=1 Tax=Microbacterium marinum TaxID=421115 RepID=UPI00384AB762